MSDGWNRFRVGQGTGWDRFSKKAETCEQAREPFEEKLNALSQRIRDNFRAYVDSTPKDQSSERILENICNPGSQSTTDKGYVPK